MSCPGASRRRGVVPTQINRQYGALFLSFFLKKKKRCSSNTTQIIEKIRSSSFRASWAHSTLAYDRLERKEASGLNKKSRNKKKKKQTTKKRRKKPQVVNQVGTATIASLSLSLPISTHYLQQEMTFGSFGGLLFKGQDTVAL